MIGTMTYMYSRIPTGPTQEPVTCAPPLPACNAPSAIDLADINRDLADPDVQAALQAALHRPTPPLYGVDMRPSDGTVFLFEPSAGDPFLVGSPCPVTSSSCMPIPAGITKLVADLRALDQQQLKDPACSGLRN